MELQMWRSDLKEASSAGGRASRRVDGIHPCELLGKVPHVQLALQLRLERSRHLLLRQVVPVQALLRGRGEHVVSTERKSRSCRRKGSQRGRGDLEEGVCLDVLGASRPGAQPPVRVLHQQLPQQVLGDGFDHGGVRRVTAQNTSDGRKNWISDESNTDPKFWSLFSIISKGLFTESSLCNFFFLVYIDCQSFSKSALPMQSTQSLEFQLVVAAAATGWGRGGRQATFSSRPLCLTCGLFY